MALEYIMGAMKSRWLSTKLSHIRERDLQKRSPWTRGRTKKKKKSNKNNNNTYHRPRSIITDMTGMENRCMAKKKKKILTFPLWFHLKTSTRNNWCFIHARFWRIFIIIQLKRSTSMSFKYNIEKDEKYWIQVLTLFSFLNAVISLC